MFKWRLTWKRIKSKNGSILAETIVGIAIYAIIMVAFASTLVTASTLFLKAQVGAREWERIFVKVENKDFSSTSDTSPAFNLTLRTNEMKYTDIILANGDKFRNDGDAAFDLSTTSTVNLVNGQVFVRYEEAVEHYATSKSSNTVYVYTIEQE